MNTTGMELTTTGNISTTELTSGYGQWNTYPSVVPSVYYHFATEPPRVCSGDVHVFPCPHCEKCKCGAATVKRQKAKAK